MRKTATILAAIGVTWALAACATTDPPTPAPADRDQTIFGLAWDTLTATEQDAVCQAPRAVAGEYISDAGGGVVAAESIRRFLDEEC